ncbi:MAG: histidine kinase [Clostridia bacterium]|nr:histidine kinase [Clostridia bacterium]
MKLSVKIVLLFSVMMLAGLLILSSIATRSTLEGANAFTEARFRNMSTSIRRDLEIDFDMMEMTLQEQTENTTFMAALNQMVRDDSEDQKMALAAGKTALNQLLQSPLVESFYRVSFYTREGAFLTTFVEAVDRDFQLLTKTGEARERIASLSWLDDADKTAGPVFLAPHEDIFPVRRSVRIYGVARQAKYHGKTIGYLEVSNQADGLLRIMDYVDNEDVSVEAVFDGGELLYASGETAWQWPDTLDEDAFTTVQMAENGTRRSVYHTYIKKLGLHLYISQDSAVNEQNNGRLRLAIYRSASYIMLPALALIILVSLGLTQSISKLSRKVKQLPSDSVLHRDDTAQGMLTTVTSPRDLETYDLEQSFNQLIRRLQDSAANEISLREGTLQAQLSALQTQINPHFIYNTLNIISAKAMEKGNFDVIEICDQFAQMLRYSTDTRSKTATMAEEIENTRNYLMLAKARYEDNLEFTIDVPENLSDITVPKLTLQPLVENALNHGFDGTNALRRLSVTGKIKDQRLMLEIRDNGTGFSEEMLRSLRERIQEIEDGKVSIEVAGGHIGLVNTCLRLHYYSQGKMHVFIRNENGAVVTISLPCGGE